MADYNRCIKLPGEILNQQEMRSAPTARSDRPTCHRPT